MVGNDYEYFKKRFDFGIVADQFLEVGSARIEGQSGNICALPKSLGITGTRIQVMWNPRLLWRHL